MRYTIVVGTEIEVKRDVNKLLALGWQLQGGVAVRATMQDGDSTGDVCMQAMTQETIDEET